MRKLVLGGAVVLVAVLAFLLWPRGGGDQPAAPASGSATVAQKTHAESSAAAGGVDGFVKDDKGAAIAGAVVRATSGAEDPVTADSGADGAFAIDLPAGTWLVTASAPDRAPATATAIVAPGQRAHVELTLAGGGVTLRGTVVDATGGPVAGALVVAEIVQGVLSTDDTHAPAAETDASGKFAIGVVPGRWTVITSHPEYVKDTRSVDVGPAGAQVDIALTPGGVVEGTVRDAGTHDPVAGARVDYAREVVASGPMRMRGASERERGTVTAGPDGKFRVAGLGSGRIILSAQSDDDRASASPTEVLLGVADTATDVDVFVAPALAIRGKVVYDDGTPAPRARVNVFGSNDQENVTAADDGTFHVGGLHAGRFQLSASTDDAPEGDPQMIELADKSVSGVTLTLHRGVFVSGRVDPAGPADITAAAPPGQGTFQPGLLRVTMSGPSARAGSDGTFRIGPFVPGKVTLDAKAADGRRGSVALDVPAAGKDGVVIPLEARGRISGRVVTRSGDPVPGAVVSIHRGADESGNQRTTIVNGVDVDADRAPTTADGKFSVSGLDPGSYELSVLDDRGGKLAFDRTNQNDPEEVVLPPDQNKDDVTLTIEPEDGTITGTVVDQNGAPVADAWVSVTANDTGMPGMDGPPPKPGKGDKSSSMMITIVDDSGPQAGEIPPVLTGDDGRFAFAHLRRGNYRVGAEGMKGAARGAADPVATGADVTVKLAALGTLRGTVTIGGKPVTDYEIQVDGPTRKQTDIHDASGKYALTALDPGSYTVEVDADAGTGHGTATLAAGQDATVDVALVGNGTVTGKLVDASGKPLAGRMVVVGDRMKAGEMRISLGGEPPTTGPDGSFTAPSPAGPRTMFMLSQQGPELRKDIDVVAGQTLDLGTLTADPSSLGAP